jgi:hypothetical protein
LNAELELNPLDVEPAVTPSLPLVETCQAEVYRMVGAEFMLNQSKRRQADRLAKATGISAWAAEHAIDFVASALSALEVGFGLSSRGKYQFDAKLRLLKLVEVWGRRRVERSEQRKATRKLEGWILAP